MIQVELLYAAHSIKYNSKGDFLDFEVHPMLKHIPMKWGENQNCFLKQADIVSSFVIFNVLSICFTKEILFYNLVIIHLLY